MRRPVRPADAASLVIVRGRGAEAEVLMGRRRPRAAFLPGVYVFPGGRVDRVDSLVPSGLRLRREVERALTRRCRSSRPTALALAAIRETFEETGLRIGIPRTGAGGRRLPGTPLWHAFEAAGSIPALGALDYIARAITPSRSPRRFNTRFFMVDANYARGDLLDDGELLDLHWRRLREATRHLKVVDVTGFVLDEVAARLTTSPAVRARRRIPLLSYVNGIFRVIHE